jgi:hypothetical protein
MAAMGVNVAINDKTLAGAGLSVIYSTTQALGGPSRMIINAQGQVVSSSDIKCNNMDCDAFTNAGKNFFAPFVLNRIDPTRIAIGGATDVYVARDTLSNVGNADVNLALTNLGTAAGPSVISYGTADNVQALAVGAGPIPQEPEIDPTAGPTTGTKPPQGQV